MKLFCVFSHRDSHREALNSSRHILAAYLVAWVFIVCSLPTPLWANEGSKVVKAGIAVAIGGALKSDNADVWGRIVSLSGGPGAKWVVFPTASGEPEQSAKSLIESLQKHGAKAEMIPLSDKLKGFDPRTVVADTKWIAAIDGASGVYFSGGAQERITAALYSVDGKPTPMLEAIWRLFRRGGVVAGSSAGAAIMSETMFREPPAILTVMQRGARWGSEIDRGLGFAGPGVFVDQHFLKRGRIGRMVAVMAQQNIKLGLGVEENSAAIIDGGDVEAIGGRGVLLVDLRGASQVGSKPLRVLGATLTWLDRGDRVDLRSGVVSPSAVKLAGKKLDHTSADFNPYNNRVRFYPDMLGDNTILFAMSELLDSPAAETRGIAFSAGRVGGSPTTTSIEAEDVGFEFRLFKTASTIGYFTSKLGGEDYSILRMGLDIVPVLMAKPLYMPLSTAGGRKAGENVGSASVPSQTPAAVPKLESVK
ncbi:MAG: cyanophycinase [Rhodocyclaceae bacterium]|nr:cyanophycinase [Rhodocyclaceae bacterium]MCA3059720.1 cyanophycinase [Rhodocyclaceae bacterium]